MPDLGGQPSRRSLDLSSIRNQSQGKPPQEGVARPAPGGRAAPGGRLNNLRRPQRQAPPPPPDPDDDDREDTEEDDEIIASSLQAKNGKGSKTVYVAIGGAIAVVLVIILFLLFGPRKKNDPAPVVTNTPTSSEAPVPTQGLGDPGVGIQDFTQNTNNTSDSPLSDPNEFVQDIYGLTTRVNYEVKGIQTATDFVNYVKKRGTWGGGLELYWLECTYRGAQYVVQVPFMYYKELDPEGIVPVKMELLRVTEGTNNETLTIVSYMCLDEATLKAVMKSAAK